MLTPSLQSLPPPPPSLSPSREGCSGRSQLILPWPGERFPDIPLWSGFWGASRVISDPSLSSPAVELFPWTTSLHAENIVIREEVTGTWGESQTFPVREAASGIEHTRPGGNLEGWTPGLLKASRGGHPRIEHRRRFLSPQLRNSTGVKDRRDLSEAGLGWAGYPESLPLKGMLEFETVCWRKRERADMVTRNLPRPELRVGHSPEWGF